MADTDYGIVKKDPADNGQWRWMEMGWDPERNRSYLYWSKPFDDYTREENLTINTADWRDEEEAMEWIDDNKQLFPGVVFRIIEFVQPLKIEFEIRNEIEYPEED